MSSISDARLNEKIHLIRFMQEFLVFLSSAGDELPEATGPAMGSG